MPGPDVSIQRRWCASIFHRAAHLGILIAAGSLLWYGTCRQQTQPDAYLSSPMSDALRRNDLASFKRYVQSLSDVDRRDAEGVTPLVVAAGMGRYDAVEYLLSNGANPNRESSAYGTPLVRAICLGNFDIAKLLLNHGADPGRMTSQGLTPLLAATRSDSAELVRILVSMGVGPVPPGCDDDNGETARVIASIDL